MSYSSGVFIINTAGQPVVTGTTITSTAFNLLIADLATGLSTAMLKDGTQTATAGIGFYPGTVSLPGIYLGSDTATGLYRIGLNNTGYSINGTKLLDLSNALVGITGALTVSTTLNVTGATTLSAALTYGGITLSNAVTGTGNMVLSASPTLTGTLTAAIANFSGAVATGTLAVTGTLSISGDTTIASGGASGQDLLIGTSSGLISSSAAMGVLASAGTSALELKNSAATAAALRLWNATADGYALSFYDTSGAARGHAYIKNSDASLHFADSFGIAFDNNVSVTGSIEATSGAWFRSSALATNATTGHFYVPTSAGAPTGVPATKTGQVALQYDSTNEKLYVYNGAWKATAALT